MSDDKPTWSDVEIPGSYAVDAPSDPPPPASFTQQDLDKAEYKGMLDGQIQAFEVIIEELDSHPRWGWGFLGLVSIARHRMNLEGILKALRRAR